MKQKLNALDVCSIEKLKLSENDPYSYDFCEPKDKTIEGASPRISYKL